MWVLLLCFPLRSGLNSGSKCPLTNAYCGETEKKNTNKKPHKTAQNKGVKTTKENKKTCVVCRCNICRVRVHVNRGRLGGMVVVAMCPAGLQWQSQRLEAGQGGGSREAGGHHVGAWMGGHGHHAPNTEVAGSGRAGGTGWWRQTGGAVARGRVGEDGRRRVPITLTAR